MAASVPYAELHAHSAFSFLDGANLPEELAAEAARLELEALALTDHGGLYGVVALARAAREVGLPTIFGAELTLPRVGAGPGQAGVVTERTGEHGGRDPQGTHLVALARDPQGYARLSRTIGRGYLARGERGPALFDLEGMAAEAAGHWLVLTGCRKGAVRQALGSDPRDSEGQRRALRALDRLSALFGRDNVAVEVTDTGDPRDRDRNAVLAELADAARLPLVATGAVHCARPADQPLADALSALRARATLEEMDGWLPAAPAHLRSGTEMARRHPLRAVETAAELGRECSFDLTLVTPKLPPFPVPAGHTETSWLRALTEAGAAQRYGPRGAAGTAEAYRVIDHELEVITALDFPGYFLIVHEIVEFCRQQGILCQGRGSAANSAVCFALGITAVDAVRHTMLFERFLSPDRSGPPDIDLDIESARREEVIQHVYARYGRTHAAQVANVISYRPRSAVRDAARVLGYDVGQQDAWAKSLERWGRLRDEEGKPAGADVAELPEGVLDIADRLMRLPRHLGIHSGGMVLCDRPVIDVCPVQWAAMEGRTVLQWDKDDCADADLVKFDLLGLGMLTALRLAFEDVNTRCATDAGSGEDPPEELALHSLPQEDPAVYRLLQAADTVGVFQVESRAQMATLPRLRPEKFYDLVVEVALIRPGPIQGKSVHPYLNRRRGREPVTYLHPLLKPALERTYGVPLFQEQLMQIAVEVAGFSPAEADRLRKAIGAKRSTERLAALKERLLAGMAQRGVGREIGEQIYLKLLGFADFGFPESHSFSFAYLVYASSWLKVHEPEAFYAALLAAQPMGFYSPQTLVADARRHGVRVERAEVNASVVQAKVERAGELRSEGPDAGGAHAMALEAGGADGRALAAGGWGKRPQAHSSVADLVHPDGALAVRLGLAPVRGVGEKTAERIVAERERGGHYRDLADLARRVDLRATQLEALATAGALRGFGVSRRAGIWSAGALAAESGVRRTSTRHAGAELAWVQEPLPWTAVGATAPALPQMGEQETMVADVWSTGVAIDSFPTSFRREELAAAGVVTVAGLADCETGRQVQVAGVVTHRQRPGTARGVTFLSLEDETGLLNVVCSPGVWARYRKAARTASALVIRGKLERADDVTNLVAERIHALGLAVSSRSRDFS
ncbi:error-prone DNA polymerase [Bogoriella caseilytica]|nr:error-prone DNA polymerase [Bogoriella caseilytica]